MNSQSSINSQVSDQHTEIFHEVLLLEDDPAHARLINRACSGLIGELKHVASAEEAYECLSNSIPELLICDFNLGSSNALDVLAHVKIVRASLPVVILTSSNQLRDAIQAMREGAADYMVKDFDEGFPHRLQLLLERVAESKRRERLELELKAERDAFWAAAHTAEDGMAILSKSGRVIFANHAFYDFAELLPGSCIDKHFSLIEKFESISQTTAASIREQLSLEQADSLWRSELHIENAGIDNKKIIKSFECKLNTVSSTILSHLNIPEQKLSSLRRHVLWVRDITTRRAKEQFQRDLLATTTHDLKGPLGAIITCVELLTSPTRDEKRSEELLMRIGSCARSAINIIDELLSARRIEDGVFVIRPTSFSIKHIIEEVLLEFDQSARARQIALTADDIDPSLLIYADKLALIRVLTNLISNGLKFTPKGGTVKVNAHNSANEVVISVKDNGNGIEKNKQHSLFTRYTRLDQHSQIDGTGLGLFVVRNIVDAHGGRIELQSNVGTGTTFLISFPHQNYSPVKNQSSDK